LPKVIVKASPAARSLDDEQARGPLPTELLRRPEEVRLEVLLPVDVEQVDVDHGGTGRKMTLPTVAEIEAMDRTALIAAWDHLFGAPAPKSLSRAFLRRFIAFEVQARRMGGLPKGFMTGLERQVASGSPRATGVQPGGRLLREWNGVTHVVEVTETGYRWKGETHRSLSAIARAITGARWSGPRFFGLTEVRR